MVKIEKTRKTSYIDTLTDSESNKILTELLKNGIAGYMLSVAMTSRVCDLEQTITIQYV